MATIVIRGPDGSEQEHEVAEQLTIGRGDGNDLVLTEGGVSRKHARFFVEGGALKVEDVGSANGTWVDGNKIEGPTPVLGKSQVVIGDYEIATKSGSKPTPKKPAPARPQSAPTAAVGKPVKAAPPRATKVVAAVKGTAPAAGAALAKRAAPGKASGPQLKGLTGGVINKTFPLSGVLTVGRVAGTDITVEDDSVSRRHAELEVRGREVVVRDLGSANGTTVNGSPISEETVLAAGDIIQFGVVEMMFETGGPSATSGAKAAAVRRSPAAPPGPRRSRPSDDDEPNDVGPPPEAPRGNRALLIGGAIVGLLFVAVFAKAMTSPTEDDHSGTTKIGGAGGTKAPETDPNDIDALLTECRSYSTAELSKPDWDRAKAACQKIIDIDPIHPDANLLLKKIEIDRACEKNLERARELMSTGRVEDALDAFAKVGAKEGECPAFGMRALDESRTPINDVRRNAGRECKEYATNAKWENAFRRCELYMRLSCQMMEDKDLYPPALTKLKLDGPLGKADWRPSDPLYINFLKAREKLKPGEPPWRCPEIRAFRPPPPPPDPRKLAKDELSKRYKDPEMSDALVRYFDGRQDAVLPLKKIRENMSRASEHEEAKALQDDIATAQNLLLNGQTDITQDSPERAEAPFRRALQIDEKLVLGDLLPKLKTEDDKRRELEKRTSFYRQAIVESMGGACYTRGKMLADRKDFRQACQVWKLGASFNRSHIDLLRALTNICTKRAQESLGRAENCEQLKQVIDFAVDGDGIKQQAEEKMTEQGCSK